MRIALVCPYAWDRPGGVQSHIRALARVLREQGEHVRVFAPAARASNVHEGDVTIVGRSTAIPWNGSVAPISLDPRAWKLRKELAAFDPHVVHLHEPLAPSLSFVALHVTDAPKVGTFHAAARSSSAYRVFGALLERSARRLAVRTAVSPTAADLARRYLGGEYVLTPNGVDVRRFSQAPPLELPAGKKVLFLGRLEPRKGAEVLIGALPLVPDTLRLIVAGTGPRERHVRALVRELGVDATFLGRVSEGDLPSVFKSADVYCAPNLGGESFGIVLLEAMAAGTPVICSDLPAFRSAAGDAALFVPPNDRAALAAAITGLLRDERSMERLRASGRRRAELFDWEQLVAGVELLYRKAIAGVER